VKNSKEYWAFPDYLHNVSQEATGDAAQIAGDGAGFGGKNSWPRCEPRRLSSRLLGPLPKTTLGTLGDDSMNGFIRGCGIALILGAVLLILINVIISPFYLQSLQQGEAVFRTSGIYLLRLSAALVDALLLLFGCLGLHLRQRGVSGKFGTVAFLVSFVGTSLLFAVEWANLFVLRAVAQTSPETLSALDKSSLMTVGFASAAGLFALGWLLLSVSLWQANVFPRWAALTTLAGLISIPALGATPLGFAGQITGNVIFGLGLVGLGYSLAKTK
jgi:hypothetical protein